LTANMKKSQVLDYWSTIFHFVVCLSKIRGTYNENCIEIFLLKSVTERVADIQ
jgi:hypothetical protein